MPNKLLQMYTSFDEDAPLKSFDRINSFMTDTLGKPVFTYEDLLLRPGRFKRMEAVIWKLLTDNSILMVPFGEVFNVLWNTAPTQSLISLFLHKDFTAATFDQMYVLEDNPDEYGDHLSMEFIKQTITDSYKNGSLTQKSVDQSYGGRAILNLDLLEQPGTEISKNPALLKTIQQIIEASPKVETATYWSTIKNSKRELILEFFLFFVFGKYKRAPHEIAATCDSLKLRNEAGYYDLIIDELNYVIDGKTEEECLQYVHMDAGFQNVKNGRSWLITLKDCLQENLNFSKLIDKQT